MPADPHPAPVDPKMVERFDAVYTRWLNDLGDQRACSQMMMEWAAAEVASVAREREEALKILRRVDASGNFHRYCDNELRRDVAGACESPALSPPPPSAATSGRPGDEDEPLVSTSTDPLANGGAYNRHAIDGFRVAGIDNGGTLRRWLATVDALDASREEWKARAVRAEQPATFVTIKRGAVVMQDFGSFEWPGDYASETIFDASESGRQPLGRLQLIAHGFGRHGSREAYGAGALYVSMGDVVESPERKEPLAPEVVKRPSHAPGKSCGYNAAGGLIHDGNCVPWNRACNLGEPAPSPASAGGDAVGVGKEATTQSGAPFVTSTSDYYSSPQALSEMLRDNFIRAARSASVLLGLPGCEREHSEAGKAIARMVKAHEKLRENEKARALLSRPRGEGGKS